MRIDGFRHVALMLALRCAAIEWAHIGLTCRWVGLWLDYLDVLRGTIAQRRVRPCLTLRECIWRKKWKRR
jgi:hypothetical protein